MKYSEISEAEVFDLAKYRKKMPYMPDFVVLDNDDPELQRAWEKIFGIYGNWHDPEWHEQWQYMGTVLKDGEWLHEFRHRAHRSNINQQPKRVYDKIVPSKNWKPTYYDILRGHGMMDNMESAVAQMAKDHPELKADPLPRPTNPMKPKLVFDKEKNVP